MDLLINNSGVFVNKSVLEKSYGEIEANLNVNVIGQILLINCFMLKQKKDLQILYVSSGAIDIPLPFALLYPFQKRLTTGYVHYLNSLKSSKYLRNYVKLMEVDTKMLEENKTFQFNVTKISPKACAGGVLKFALKEKVSNGHFIHECTGVVPEFVMVLVLSLIKGFARKRYWALNKKKE